MMYVIFNRHDYHFEIDLLTFDSELSDRPKAELTKDELDQLEEYEFKHGPLSLINDSMKTKTPVIISLRNNHKIIARVKAFDRHCNMVLENVKELWTERRGNKAENKERFISKLFLRGDSVIVVLKAPMQ
ncbi:hypothetical protein HG536_0H04100 [Torulaspora globosa]|uniref:Small nuclear ribonucleoprotein Sm D2 n=1 Tax=Torulaspora globosa TaxID=48254 RepID=A0A7G3ZNE8_9SACH|nr:uncharacterized protein HG536_0H04100 [Torulaspora globosa]QLL35034.1 hypothetical protein HG536_0H04100 [Torulaspora globosa]